MLELDPYRPLPNAGETAILEIRPSVAVIGAGVSGLIAARILAEHGYPVTVIDKGRRPGGRSSTRTEGDFIFDHGCQYFTARDGRFQRYVNAWTEQGIVSPWNARRASCRHGVVSAVEDEITRYVGVPGMNAVARHLAKDMDVQLGVTITGIEPDARGWRLIGATGYPETVELVISSAPPAQTAEIFGPHAPASPALAAIPMQPCWTVMVTFDYDLDAAFDAGHFSASPLVWAANNSTKPGRAAHECWVLHASPSWTTEHFDDPPDHVAANLLAAFFQDAGIPPVQPRFLGAHRWRYASPAQAKRIDGYWDPERGLGFCGDWCHSARLEGAFLSGLELAERIMDDRPRSHF
ncbi:MAG TPA: FAD-dependent oxidoreductase [Kiritimatiellia bacterium]|nr:FAD-dependent oxidoreductase [Kiritimatiellia bacterium]HMO98466.1 FAD-dependent oxidoreductase [Kiritimatiellia bacterium]HMP96522.1 FAD-dependent oxidoreductase [Kiritimatiellia bacterium]